MTDPAALSAATPTHIADIDEIKAVYSTGWIAYRDEDSRAKALACAKGRYQEALIEGREAWSGSTLKGKAADWGSAYRRSRQSLLGRLRGAGLRAVFVRVGRGHRKVLVVG
jgi:hypothetical protein